MFSYLKKGMGLDIGTRTLKGLSLKRLKGTVSIEQYLFHDLAVSNASYPETTHVEQNLKAVLETTQLKTNKVFSMLENSEVAHINFSIPQMPDKEIGAAVLSEVEEQLGISAGDLAFDFFYHPIEEEGVQKLNIKVYWVRREYVEKRLQLFTSVGLNPIALEPTVMAHIAMLQFNQYVEPGKNYIAVDLGEGHTSLTLISDGIVNFTHGFPIGSGSVNGALRTSLGISYEEAENHKTGTVIDIGAGGGNEINGIVNNAYLEILKSVKESTDFAIAQCKSMECAYLLGGGCFIQKIDTALQALLGIPVILPNPFKNIEVHQINEPEKGEALAANAGYFSAAVGLALRGIE